MQMNRTRICIPIFTFQRSGGMRVLTKLAIEWASSGNDVTMVVADDSNPYFPLSESVKVINLGIKKRIKRIKGVEKYLNTKFNEYDIFLANQNATTLPIYCASRKNKDYSKNYYYVQAYEPEFYSLRNIKELFKYIIAIISYKLPFILIVNSNVYRDYKLLSTDKVVFPGLDLNVYHSKDTAKLGHRLKIGTIGRVEPWKGTKTVCEAMELLHKENVDFEFYIAFNDFETIPHHFVRPDGDENLAAFYRDMDIVIAACKGQHGAIHYPVIETMAVGSTIVCTDYYPANESNAYVVEEDSPEQIAAAVKEILRDRDTAVRRRRQALADVRQFDWPIVAEKFLGYLKEEDAEAARK